MTMSHHCHSINNCRPPHNKTQMNIWFNMTWEPDWCFQSLVLPWDQGLGHIWDWDTWQSKHNTTVVTLFEIDQNFIKLIIICLEQNKTIIKPIKCVKELVFFGNHMINCSLWREFKQLVFICHTILSEVGQYRIQVEQFGMRWVCTRLGWRI